MDGVRLNLVSRIDELSFTHPAVLHRGDGSGVAAVLRQTPVGTGPSWARVVDPAVGIPSGYLYIGYHGWDAAVFAAAASATDEAPGRTDLDPRLRALGEYFEDVDADAARVADAAGARRSQAAAASIRDATFSVVADVDEQRWTVEVRPTIAGETSLVLSDGTGARRLLTTTVPRAQLESARTAATTIEALASMPRRFGSGQTQRTVTLRIGPAEAAG